VVVAARAVPLGPRGGAVAYGSACCCVCGQQLILRGLEGLGEQLGCLPTSWQQWRQQ